LIQNYDSIISKEKIEKMFQSMERFFELPLHVKQTLKSSHNRGYFSFGEENLSTVYTTLNESLANKDLGDYKEGFDIGREIDSASTEFGLPFRHANKWPECLGKEWKDDILDYFQIVTRLGHILMKIFATSLQLNEAWFEDKLDKPMTVLRLLHYPPATEEPRFGCGAHSDYGCCAVLAQDDAGGLQLLNSSQQWIDIPCIPNTLVVNIGDMMQRWTNNTFKSTVHRVLNPSGKHRFSLPFFFEPNFDAVVECIETCKKEGALFPPVKFGTHLQNMYTATFKEQEN